MYDELHLLPGEKLLWSGSPTRHPIFDVADLVLVPLSVIWCSFVVVWEASAIHSRVIFAVLWGIPFFLYGIYLLVGRLVVRFMRLRSTRYAVTDRRVIEISDSPLKRRAEAYVRDLPPPVLKTKEGAVGSVAFGSFPTLADGLADAPLSGWRRGKPRPIVLREISQPHYVRDAIATAQSRPSPGE